VIATVTVPVNELTALAVTLTEPLAPPMVRESDVGDRVREKSGGAGTETVSETVAVCVVVPDVPVKVTVDVPAAAVEPAVRVMVWAAPGLQVTEVGLAVTPVGNPEMAMVTAPVNPLMAVAVMPTVCPDAPAVRVSEVGAAAREKSGAGVTVDPPPQPRTPYTASNKLTLATVRIAIPQNSLLLPKGSPPARSSNSRLLNLGCREPYLKQDFAGSGSLKFGAADRIGISDRIRTLPQAIAAVSGGSALDNTLCPSML
jgi:hypothetical protein